jgi:hypothetical protein
MADDVSDMTVREAVSSLVANVERGARCPCCGQFAKAYKRRVRGNHARFLFDVARLATDESPWVHYKQCFFAGRDYNYLRHFGLADVQEREGLWKLTQLGARFLMGDVGVPAWILVFNNEVVDRAKETRTVRECLAQGGFDYDALMYGEGS